MRLQPLEQLASEPYVRTVPFARDQRLFLCVQPQARTAFQIAVTLNV